MAADSSDDEAGDLVFMALLMAGAYVFYNYWRGRQAGSSGGIYFPQAAPPAQTTTENFLNVLVPMQLSAAGAAYIKGYEKFRANAYPDGGKMSIGYGHQIQPGENIIGPITQAEAQQLFDADAARVSQAVDTALKVPVTQNQFDALVDLAYNIGTAAFAGSTLLRLLNAGDYAGAAGQFAAWKYSAGQVNSDLVQRRSADSNLFNS